MSLSIETQIGNLLRQRSLKLAVAKSCTGGLIGHRITNVPGSSDYFTGGVIAYANEAKVKLLGVSWDTLNSFRRGQSGDGAGDGSRSTPEPGGGYRRLGQRDRRARGRIARQTGRNCLDWPGRAGWQPGARFPLPGRS